MVGTQRRAGRQVRPAIALLRSLRLFEPLVHDTEIVERVRDVRMTGAERTLLQLDGSPKKSLRSCKVAGPGGLHRGIGGRLNVS
jgi:hypothetical protein